jgi:hypothetical protein
MKKTLLFAATALTLVFAGCKKEDKTTSITLPSPELGTANIQGLIKAQLDVQAGNTALENVANKDVVVTIETADWYSTAPANAPLKRYKTQTNDLGRFNIDVEVGSKQLTKVEILVLDFTFDQVQDNAGGKKLFKYGMNAPELENNVKRGDVRIHAPITLSATIYQ